MTTETLKTDDGQLTIWFDGPVWRDHGTVATVGKCKFTSVDAGARLLGQAAALAKSKGATALIGPMEGDTWHAYRLISDRGEHAPFLMEPSSGHHDEAAFKAAGFDVISSYFSASAPCQNYRALSPKTAVFLRSSHGTGPILPYYLRKCMICLVRHLRATRFTNTSSAKTSSPCIALSFRC